MIKQPKPTAQPAPKKSYQPPRLKKLGDVRTLTLKTGSDADGFGGHF